MLTYILFLLWFPVLIKWADMLVSWASNIALRYGIPSLVVWLTIVAFWTSAPELAVNIFAALRWSTELIMWNILWSNISNILLILWVTACIISLPAQKSTIYKEIPFSLFTVLLLLVLWLVFGGIWFFSWFIFLFLLVWFLYYNFKLIRDSVSISKETQKTHKIDIRLTKNIVYIILGLIWLVLWWKWIVDGAVQIALHFGMSELVVWLTIIAIGTSLPELATSVIAAFKWESDIAIGNIIGSNIFNVLLVLWVSWLITDISIHWDMYRDIMINIWASLLLLLFLLKSSYHSLTRIHGSIFVLLFLSYITYLLFISLS